MRPPPTSSNWPKTFATVDVGGLTGGEFVEQFAPDHPGGQIVRRRLATPSPAYQAQVTEHICDEACGSTVACRSIRALEHHDRIRRKFLVDEGSSLTLIDRGIASADRSRSQLWLVNRETGQLDGEIDVPSAYWQLAPAGEGSCGQLLPICGRAAHGLSLLERRSVWSTADPGDEPPRDKVKVGPIGHDYCVLQTTRTLSVVHPATGELRWTRDDLSPCIGLMGNEGTGIIGDARTLTVFDADQLHYTVYRMRSGRLVRTGCLDLPMRPMPDGIGVRWAVNWCIWPATPTETASASGTRPPTVCCSTPRCVIGCSPPSAIAASTPSSTATENSSSSTSLREQFVCN